MKNSFNKKFFRKENQHSRAVGMAREKRGLYPRTKRPKTENIQPSLFD